MNEKWKPVLNEGMDLSSVPDGLHLVRAEGQAMVVAKMRGRMWFRTDGGGDGILWFRPTEYAPVAEDA